MPINSDASDGPTPAISAESLEATLASLASEVNRLHCRLDRLDEIQAAAESMFAATVDVVDEQAARLHPTDGPADARLAGLLQMVEQSTRPATLDALASLLDRASQLAELASLADAAPDFVAALADVFDEWAAQQSARGIDVAEAAQRGLRSLLWLGQRISEVELDRLGMLLRSDVLDPKALQVVGNAATALAQCQAAACDASQPERAGLWAGLRALGDPKTQQSLAFAIRFSQKFGELAGKPCHGFSEPQESP